MTTLKKTHRQRQKEDTKDLILATAYKLFAERGYAATTMRLLAEQAGVGLGTIFKHFPDKPSLLVEAYQGDLGNIIIEAFKTIPESGNRNQLLHVTRQIYRYYASNTEFSKALIKETLFLEGEHGKILDEQLRSFLESISELISAAVKRRELSKDTDVFESTQAYASIYFSLLVMALKKQEFDVEREIEVMKRMLGKYFGI